MPKRDLALPFIGYICGDVSHDVRLQPTFVDLPVFEQSGIADRSIAPVSKANIREPGCFIAMINLPLAAVCLGLVT